MTILAARLSLTAATAIGSVYDPSTRNGPAPLCRDPSLLCELCPSKNSPSRTMLTPSAGPSANAAADSRHKATSSVFSSGCGCRSSANHTPRSRRISGSRTTLPRPPSALRRGKPRVGVYSTQSRRYAARQRAPRPRLDPSRRQKIVGWPRQSHSPLINGSKRMTGFCAWPPIGR